MWGTAIPRTGTGRFARKKPMWSAFFPWALRTCFLDVSEVKSSSKEHRLSFVSGQHWNVLVRAAFEYLNERNVDPTVLQIVPLYNPTNHEEPHKTMFFLSLAEWRAIAPYKNRTKHLQLKNPYMPKWWAIPKTWSTEAFVPLFTFWFSLLFSFFSRDNSEDFSFHLLVSTGIAEFSCTVLPCLRGRGWH